MHENTAIVSKKLKSQGDLHRDDHFCYFRNGSKNWLDYYDFLFKVLLRKKMTN